MIVNRQFVCSNICFFIVIAILIALIVLSTVFFNISLTFFLEWG